MGRALTRLTVFAVALVAILFALRLASDAGSWHYAITRSPDAYPLGGRALAPWVKQYYASVAFLLIGAIVSIALRPREWRQTLEPWLFGAALLCALAAVGLTSSPMLRVYATWRDQFGNAGTDRFVGYRQVVVFAVSAVGFAAIALRARRHAKHS